MVFVIVCVFCKVFLADFLHLVILVSVCVGRKCNASYHNSKFKHHVKKRKLIEKAKFLVMTVAANPSLLKVKVKRVFLRIRENFCTERIECHVSFQKKSMRE